MVKLIETLFGDRLMWDHGTIISWVHIGATWRIRLNIPCSSRATQAVDTVSVATCLCFNWTVIAHLACIEHFGWYRLYAAVVAAAAAAAVNIDKCRIAYTVTLS